MSRKATPEAPTPADTLISLGRAALALLDGPDPPALPEGFARSSEGLAVRGALDIALLGEPRRLTGQTSLGAKMIGKRLSALGLEGPEGLTAARLAELLEADRPAMQAKLAASLAALGKELEGHGAGLAAVARDPSLGAELARVLALLPAEIPLAQGGKLVGAFARAAARLARSLDERRLLAYAEQAGLGADIERLRATDGGVTVRVKRTVHTAIGDESISVPVSVDVAFDDDALERIDSGEALARAIEQGAGRAEKRLRDDVRRALKYASAVLEEVKREDRELGQFVNLEQAVREALARGGDVKTWLTRSIKDLAKKGRADKFQSDVSRLEAHHDRYADVGQYYPVARELGRKITLFVGPTNSGKTYRSLNLLAKASSGVYLAPLRLLALEGQAEIEARGRACSFLTGEERDLREGANFVSSTIEMLDFQTVRGAVLIDEIQLLREPGRGWAWTAALVGAPAPHVILTGSPDCLEAVRQIAATLGEELTVVETERLAPLEVSRKNTPLDRVAAGTAVIAFSRRDVLDLKNMIESQTKLPCSVIYGNLSPRVRREEARRFREGETKVLVSTDAIAMGLNLPIEAVVFHTTVKFDGQRERRLDDHELIQIAGRAGRFGKAARGLVSAFTPEGLRDVRLAFSRAIRPVEPPFRVMPDDRHVELLAQVLETTSLERILVFFEQAVTFTEDIFRPADLTDLCALARLVDRALPDERVRVKLLFASAPVELTNDDMLRPWLRMMAAYLANDERTLGFLFDPGRFRDPAGTTDASELLEAEVTLKVLTVYAWLAYRFPERFRRIDDCDQVKDVLATFIEASLRRRPTRRCATCGARLDAGFRFKQCDGCHFGRRRAPAFTEDELPGGEDEPPA